MLDLAKHKLPETMHALRPALDRSLPIVVLEPSCASVFRDELLNLFRMIRMHCALAGNACYGVHGLPIRDC
jgi:hypothetical protein